MALSSTARNGAWPLAVTLLLGASAAGSCGEDGTPLPEERTPRRPPEGSVEVPSTPQRDGDPAEGRRHLLESPYVSCGLPASVVDGGRGAALAPLLGLGEVAAPPERAGPNADLPYFLTASTAPNGVPLAALNCLLCHAAPFEGELVIGLGNPFLDQTIDLAEAAKLIDGGLGPADREAFAEWRDRVTTVAPAIALDTIGVTAADNLALELFARRDPTTLAWRGDYQVPVPDGIRPVPIATPPLWRMAKKNAMFYPGGGRGDHARFMLSASSLCIDDVSDVIAIDAYFHHVRSYIASLAPPPYPFAVDEGLARRGEPVFVEHCSGCHGTYGASPSYPNLIIPIEAVRTDPALHEYEHAFVEIMTPWMEASPLASTMSFVETAGYYAPPLDGVWMTAPFLHNDSVPTLAALLDSRRRPARFTKRAAWDEDAVGWQFDVHDEGKVDGDGSLANRALYDTTRFGYGNGGHTFGDVLDDAEREALLEYLKTL